MLQEQHWKLRPHRSAKAGFNLISDIREEKAQGLQQKNGVNVEGAKSSSNSAAVTDFNGMSFSTVVKVLPSCASIDNTTTLTVLNTGVGAIYSNTNITVVKLC